MVKNDENKIFDIYVKEGQSLWVPKQCYHH